MVRKPEHAFSAVLSKDYALLLEVSKYVKGQTTAAWAAHIWEEGGRKKSLPNTAIHFGASESSGPQESHKHNQQVTIN